MTLRDDDSVEQQGEEDDEKRMTPTMLSHHFVENQREANCYYFVLS
jgi:hypothetical protein